MLRRCRTVGLRQLQKSCIPHALTIYSPIAAHGCFYHRAGMGTAPATLSCEIASHTTFSSPLEEVMATPAPPHTYLDVLERVWNSKWFGTVDESAAAVVTSSDPSAFAHVFLFLEQFLGVEAGTALLVVGALTRVATLFFSFYGERAGERMRLALPKLTAPQMEFNKVYFNDFASAMEVHVAASVLKSHRRAIFRQFQTSNLKCIASLCTAPITLLGLYQVSALCEHAALHVGSSSYLWCSALALPDPFLLLPLLTCVITLVNFELSVSKDIKTGWMWNIIWSARLGCLCIVPVAASFRAGVCLYLLGMNVVGLLQPLLLRSATFRRWFDFPSAEELSVVSARARAGTQHERARSNASEQRQKRSWRERLQAIVAPSTTAQRSGPQTPSGGVPTVDILQTSLTVQFPYLSHLLNPQVEENADLFSRNRNKPSNLDAARRASSGRPAHGSRYARGVNPLMPEPPLHRQSSTGPSVNQRNDQASGRGEVNAVSATGSATHMPKFKGSTFASAGWRSAQVSFEESDFVPNYDAKKAADSRAPRYGEKRKDEEPID